MITVAINYESEFSFLHHVVESWLQCAIVVCDQILQGFGWNNVIISWNYCLLLFFFIKCIVKKQCNYFDFAVMMYL